MDKLKTDYTDASWVGLKKFRLIENEDGTVSFEDKTLYQNHENSFFSASDINKINEAINLLLTYEQKNIITGSKIINPSDWVPDTSISDYQYKYSFEIEGVSEDYFLDIYVDEHSLQASKINGITYCRINTNKLEIFAEHLPNTVINFDYYLKRGIDSV